MVRLVKETRRFDESTGKTILMRVKEGSDVIVTSQNQILYLYMSMMSGKNVCDKPFQNCLTNVKLNMLMKGLPEYDAHVLTLTKEMSDFFEGAIEHGADVKQHLTG